MADNDVSALFKNRKAKKGKKKFKSFSANRIVKQLESGVADEDIDMNQASTDDAKTVTKSVSTKHYEMEGDWVDDDEPAVKTSFLSNSSVGDLTLSAEKTVEEVQEEDNTQQSKMEFHLARAKAIKEQEKKEEKVVEEKPKVEEKRVWRPRQVLQSKTSKNKELALKELDNEQVFPSLGGKKAAPAPKAAAPKVSAWGNVDKQVVEKLEEQEALVAPVYLGKTFIECASFDGMKPGYKFSAGDRGVGYYWESDVPEGETDESAPKEEEEAESLDDRFKPSAGAWRPSRRPMNTELPPEESDEEGEDKPKADDDDDRFKPSKNAWRPSSRPMNTELPPAESDEEDAKPAPTPAAAPAAVEQVAEKVDSLTVTEDNVIKTNVDEADIETFSALKKKKKKKKKAEE